MGQDGAASRRSPTPGETPEAPAVEGDNHEPPARDADRFPESYCRPLEELERRHKERHVHRAVTERQRVTVSENYGQPRMPAVQLGEHLRRAIKANHTMPPTPEPSCEVSGTAAHLEHRLGPGALPDQPLQQPALGLIRSLSPSGLAYHAS